MILYCNMIVFVMVKGHLSVQTSVEKYQNQICSYNQGAGTPMTLETIINDLGILMYIIREWMDIAGTDSLSG